VATEYYTDEYLRQAQVDGSPGERNSAPYLLELDTVERRMRAVSEAHTLSNLLGFRHSQAVREAVNNLQDLIEAGREDQELYGERTAREYREAEKLRRGY
jgi:hypothetical protein